MKNNRLWFIALLVLMLGFIGVFVNGQTQSYREKLARATTDSQNMARVLEEQINSVIQKTDILLIHASGEVIQNKDERFPANGEVHAYLRKLQESIPETFRIRVIQPDGFSLASSLEEKSSRPYYGDRAYFIRHRDNPELGLDISEPIVGRTHHGWQIMLSRRLNYADGSFAGIVSSGIALSYFEDFFSTLDLGKNSNITLLSKDLHVITRFPISESQRMKSVRDGPIAAALHQNATKGTTFGKSSVDGVERIFSYRQVGNLPLLIVVGLSKQDVLAEWRQNALIDSAVMLGLLFAIGMLSFNLMRNFKKEQESKNQLREITSTLGEGVYVLDEEGKVTFVNPEMERLLGWTQAELLGRSGHETFHYKCMDGTPTPTHACPVHQAILTGQTYRSTEDNMVCKDGTPIPVSIVSSPILRDGKVKGSVASFQDITPRLEAEKVLREREARFRLLFNSGNDAILVHLMNEKGGRGRFVEVNNVACRMLEYSRDELMQMSPHDIDNPECTSDMEDVAQQIQSNGYALFERTHVTKSGKKIPVEISSHVFEMDGTPLLMSVVRDISERKQSELEYKAILQTTRDGFLIVDTRNNRFIDVNDAYCRMLGYSRDELLQLSTHEVEASETSEETEVHVRELVAQGYGRFETRHRCKNGELIDVEVSLNYLDIKGGVFITFIRDIRERKLARETQDRLERNQRALLDAARESALLLEKDGTILAINQVGAKRLHGTPGELLGKNVFDLTHPEVANVRRKRLEKVTLEGVPSVIEDERNGTRMVNSIYPVIDVDGKINRVAVYSTDVTEQRLLEAIEDLFSAINQQVLRGETLDKVLEFICERVTLLFNLEMAWLGRKESDGTVSVMTYAGSANEYAHRLAVAGVRWDETPQGLGPTGAAIRTEQSQTLNSDDPRFKTWAAIAHEYRLQAILSVPLMVHGEIYGAFTLYSHDPSAFLDPVMVNRLVGIADRISMALEMGRDQQQLRLLSMALASAANAVMVTDQQGRIQWANAAFSRLSGYGKEEIIGQSPRILKSGQQDKTYYQTLWRTINNGEVWSSETVERKKDGSLYTVMQTITPLSDVTGRITHFIAIHEDVTDQKRTRERMSHMAQYDGLTDLPNRALFYDRLHQALNLAKRSKVGLALMFLDLDRFKQINDTLGHHIGDLLLKNVAERLSQCVRESDTVARLGGDEFTVLLYDLRERDDIGRIAEKIITSISQPYVLEGKDVCIGVSIGIARFTDDTADEDRLMNLADKAMYRAKSEGRNTFRFCGSSNHTSEAA